jgi:hypothetical protein
VLLGQMATRVYPLTVEVLSLIDLVVGDAHDDDEPNPDVKQSDNRIIAKQ